MECHEASSPEPRAFSETARDAHCRYCGRQPCTAGSDVLALVTGAQELKFMCMPCSMEHNRYIQEQLVNCPSGLGQQEQLTFVRKLDKEADEHMERWLSERSSR